MFQSLFLLSFLIYSQVSGIFAATPPISQEFINFYVDPFQFLNSTPVHTFSLDGQFLQDGLISFDFKQDENTQALKIRKVPALGDQYWLNTKGEVKVELTRKPEAIFIFTSQLGGCTLFSQILEENGKVYLHVFHHYATSSCARPKFTPKGVDISFANAFTFEEYDFKSSRLPRPWQETTTAIIYKNPSDCQWYILYQALQGQVIVDVNVRRPANITLERFAWRPLFPPSSQYLHRERRSISLTSYLSCERSTTTESTETTTDLTTTRTTTTTTASTTSGGTSTAKTTRKNGDGNDGDGGSGGGGSGGGGKIPDIGNPFPGGSGGGDRTSAVPERSSTSMTRTSPRPSTVTKWETQETSSAFTTEGITGIYSTMETATTEVTEEVSTVSGNWSISQTTTPSTAWTTLSTRRPSTTNCTSLYLSLDIPKEYENGKAVILKRVVDCCLVCKATRSCKAWVYIFPRVCFLKKNGKLVYQGQNQTAGIMQPKRYFNRRMG